MECSICLEAYTDLVAYGVNILLCPNGHSLCSLCEGELLHRICPTCNTDFPVIVSRNYQLESYIAEAFGGDDDNVAPPSPAAPTAPNPAAPLVLASTAFRTAATTLALEAAFIACVFASWVAGFIVAVAVVVVVPWVMLVMVPFALLRLLSFAVVVVVVAFSLLRLLLQLCVEMALLAIWRRLRPKLYGGIY
jgi:hypothetical protein